MDTLRRLIQKHSYCLDLLALGALAGVMRLWGLGFDLPNLYHRDEARYVSIPLNMLKSGDYNPHFFNYPTLFFYLLSLGYILYFLFMVSRGHLGSLDGLTLPEQVLPNVVGRATMPSQLLAGRGMVAVCGVLTVLLVYWIGRQAHSRRAGLIAALLLSVSPTHIRNSHFVAPDVAMILVAVASFWFSYQILVRGRWQDYLLAGLLAGFATSTKYNAYSALVPLLVAHVLRSKRGTLMNAQLVVAILACIGSFFLGTPYAFLDLPAFLNGLAFEVRHYAMLGDPGIEGKNALLWYASFLLRTEGLAPLLAGLEAVRGLQRRSHKTLLFASFPAAYLLLTSFYAVKNDRTVLTIVPFLVILAGAFLDRALTSVQRRLTGSGKSDAVARFSAAACVLLMLLWPAQRAVQINTRFAQDDVRTQVTRWMEAELPPGSRIVGEYYSPLLEDSVHHFRWVDRAIDQPITWYEANADYVVFVENRYGGFYLDVPRYSAEVSAYEGMFSRFTLVQEFQGGALGNPCHAKLYKVGVMKKLPLVLIGIVALALRLLNAFLLPWQGGDLVISDMKGYDRVAMALLEQKPISVHTAEEYLFHPLGSDTYHPPGYYFFLAGVYAVAGHSYLAVRIAQAIVGTGTCILVCLLGKDIFGESAGILAAALVAVSPPLIFYTGVLLTETLSTFLLTGAAWLVVRFSYHRSRWALLILAGLVMGLAVITRSALLTVAPFLLAWLLLVVEDWPGWRTALRCAVALVAPLALVVLPISVRNYQIHGKLILISTNGGVNFFLGHGGTQRLKNQVRNLPEVFSEGQVRGVSNRTQPEEEADFYRLGWEYVLGHPLQTIRSIPDKLMRMYWDSDYWPASDMQAGIMRSTDLVLWKSLLLPLSLICIALYERATRRRAWLLYLVIASTLAIPLVFWAMPRFRVPVLPCFITLAAGTLCELYRRLTRQRKPKLEILTL